MRDLRTPTLARGARFMLAAVALALFGLLSMHGWGSHAGGHAMAITPAPGAMIMEPAHPAVHGHVSITDRDPTTSDTGATDSSAPATAQEKPSRDPGTGMLGLCLAVLAGLLFVAVARLVARRRVRVPRLTLPVWPLTVVIGRDRDPPDLLRLCVIRC